VDDLGLILFWKRRLVHGWKEMEKEIKVRLGLEATIQLWTTLLHLGSLQRSVVMIKLISFIFSLILENLLTLCPGLTFKIG